MFVNDGKSMMTAEIKESKEKDRSDRAAESSDAAIKSIVCGVFRRINASVLRNV